MQFPDLSTINPSEVLEQFEHYQLAQGLARSTVENRASVIRALGHMTEHPATASVFTLRRFLAREDLTQGSRRTYRGVLAAFFSFLQEEGLRDDNPVDRVPTISVRRGRPRPFTMEQIDAMLDAGAYRRTRAMILLGYYQGFRVSQIARTRGDDIDLLTNTIHTIGKGGKEGWLPLHTTVRDLAQDMPPTDYWFPARGTRRGHIQPASVTDLVRKAKDRAGIVNPKLTAHSLRHGFATDLVEEGLDVRVVQELMMHESLSTTQIYTGVSERRKQNGIQLLPTREIPRRSGRRNARRTAAPQPPPGVDQIAA
jgi:integrase/recombinase XerD